LDLNSRRCAVRARGAGMSRHDVPEKDVSVEVQILEHGVDDRRRRLARATARELALGREGDARDAGAAVAGRFANEQDRRGGALLEVARESLRQTVFAVLVERVADPRDGEALYQRSQWTTSSSGRLRCDMRLDARLEFGSGRGLPSVTPATTQKSSGMASSSLNAFISGTVTP